MHAFFHLFKSTRPALLTALLCMAACFPLACRFGYEVAPLADTGYPLSTFLTDYNWKQRQPIHPTNVRITNDLSEEQFPHKIKITCPHQLEEKGIAYCIINWFETEAAATQAYKEALTRFFTVDSNRLPQSSRPLAPNFQEWEHQNLASGQTFYYLVKNYKAHHELVGCTVPLIGQTVKLPFRVTAEKIILEVPKEGALPVTQQLLTVSWEWKSEWKCSGFNVYRGNSVKTIDFKHPINSLPLLPIQRSYKDKVSSDAFGRYLYYAVKPIFDRKPTQAYSEIAMGKIAKPGSPSVPEAIRITPHRDHIQIQWQEDANANTYRFHYKTQASDWETIDIQCPDLSPLSAVCFYPTQSNEKAKLLLEPQPLLKRPAHADFFAEYTLNFEGVRVDANSGNELSGIPSEDMTVAVLPPPTVTRWSYLNSADCNRIEWSGSPSDTGFDLFRSQIDCFSPQAPGLQPTRLTPEPITDLFYEDTGAETQTRYFYWVQAHTEGGETSFESESAAAIRGINQPEFTLSHGETKYITVRFSGPKNPKVTLTADYADSQYSPSFQVKNGKNGQQAGTATRPASYADSLNYKCDPHLHFSDWKHLVTIPAAEGTPASPDPFQFTFGSTQTEAFTSLGAQTLCNNSDLTYSDKPVRPGWMKVRMHYTIPVKTFSLDSSGTSVTEGSLSVTGPEVIREGYRQIDPVEFAFECLQHIAYSQNIMTNIHEKAGLQDPGPAHEEWILRNGQQVHSDPGAGNWAIAYLGKAAVPVVVPIRYDRFKHPDGYLTISDPKNGNLSSGDNNDKVQTTRVGITANGNLWGGDYFSGIYNGHLFFNLTITSSNKSGGTYEVYYDGSADGGTVKKSIPWNFDQAFFK